MSPGTESQGVEPEVARETEPEREMGDIEYALEFKRLRIGVEFLKDIQCAGMLAKISRCGTVAPILDPTLYMYGRERLEIVQELVRAAGVFQSAAVKFDRRMVETDAAARRSREFLERVRPRAAIAEVAS